ncbi:hypothetical protein MTR67_035446 [Solanum verrucosum]|uniref:Reverse transcriptase RNase H-like domain-containing protein n=1 Tax=Solanum verrucosum TaxID=315347 RepID=A0AAF0ZJW0_SOLVR|nr:hypothetical protein MTR67_035446 [Solanum verrucosum]
MQHGKVITYASRQLQNHKNNYLIHALKLATIIHALNIWMHYLYGLHVEIYTNYKSIKYSFKTKELNLL